MSLLCRTRSAVLRASALRGSTAAARVALKPAQSSSSAAPMMPPVCAAQRRCVHASAFRRAEATTTAASGEASQDASSLFPTPLEHLRVSLDPALQALTVTMNRAELHNAFNEHVIREITTVFETLGSECAKDGSPLSSLRAVVLTGAGASFSAGADLNWMKKMRSYTEAENLSDSRALFRMFLLLQRCPVPTIARVNGAALGGGVGLVAACDIAVAHQDAKFGLTEVRLGLSPAVISSFVMQKLSPSSANLLFLTGSRFGASEAKEHGLLNQVAEDEAGLDAAVRRTVEELALNSPQAVRATKQLLATVRATSGPVEQAEDYCTRLIARLRVSGEGQEGLNSFFEKRKASWIPAHLGNPKPKKK